MKTFPYNYGPTSLDSTRQYLSIQTTSRQKVKVPGNDDLCLGSFYLQV